MDTIDSFGYWVRRRRKVLDLTQEELAQRVGCAAVTLRKIEADERRPSVQMAKRFAHCLALPDAECSQFIAAALGRRLVTQLPIPSNLGSRKPPGNLPAPVTSLVGRSTEIATISDCLRTQGVRLLTLTGPVGVGKTRLALEAGQRLLGEYRDGVFLVALAPVQDPAVVPTATAMVLGVREARDCDLTKSVADFLAAKESLLIFDNFEHLLPATSFLSELLSTCTDLRVLVTSRARLHLYGEHEMVVLPLALPERDDPLNAADVAAVRLFCDRAQAAQAGFHLTPSLTPVVAEICRRLDGLPLAIELAAARIRLFSPQELQQRLEHRLPLLSHGAADMLPRLRGLETAIAWSYGVLSPAERILFSRLAVFVDGFSLRAAKAVCDFPFIEQVVAADHETSLTLPDVAQGVESLLDQSLLSRRTTESGSPSPSRIFCARCPSQMAREAAESVSRFFLLETIREFALDRLRANGELAMMQQSHAEYFVDWAEQAESQLNGPDQVVWLAQLERESDNLRTALTWLLATRQLTVAARLACALGAFWQRHGHYSEGRRWLQQILEQVSPDDLPDTLRARTLQAAASLAHRQGNRQMAQQWLMESLTLFGTADPLGVARVLFDLGWIAIDSGDWTEGVRLNQESLALARAADDPCATYQALTNLGWAQLSAGHEEIAETLFGEALEHAQRIEHVKGIAVSLANLGWIALYQGDMERAASLVHDSLRLCCLLGEREVLAECLDVLAIVAVRKGDACRAAHLSGAAEVVWQALHIARSPADHSTTARDQALGAMHEQLGEAVFDAVWRQGRALSLDAAVALALGCGAALVQARRWKSAGSVG